MAIMMVIGFMVTDDADCNGEEGCGDDCDGGEGEVLIVHSLVMSLVR